jgi:organic hydroperoxide reductase OsmC/OhrA
MIKPYINDEVEDRLKIAKDKIFYLAQFAEKEEIQFKASQDIADRVEGKPTQKIITEGSLNVNMDITKLSDEELDKILRTPRN